MSEFTFWQVTLNKSQSCDKFNLFRIMTVNRWCDKFKDTVSENIETV